MNHCYKVRESRAYVWDVGLLDWVPMQQPILEAGSVMIGGTVDVSDRAGRVVGVVTGPLTNTQLRASEVAVVDETFRDSRLVDAFGRLRISPIQTLFDSKQTFSNEPLFWDDQETSGGGTSTAWAQATARSTLGVSLNTAGTRVRQTFMRYNYQPGKSHLIAFTGSLAQTGGGAGVTSRAGLFDANDGLFFQYNNGGAVVRRSSTSGSPVNETVLQANWNIDKMDGTGVSGITLDWTKYQIFWIDFEWFGIGRVRFGVVIGGLLYYVHEMTHANLLNVPYMSTPNLPMRYEISNDGTGAASTITHGCVSVMSEGVLVPQGVLQYATTTTHVDADAAGTMYALVGIRLKAAALGATILINNMSVLALTADDFEWTILLNPTVAGTFTFADKTNSSVQTAFGATANTVTNGTAIAGGQAQAGSVSELLENALRLGSTIAGVAQTLVLCARPHTANADIHGALSWRELQ